MLHARRVRATRSGGRPKDPLVYLGVLAVVVGISLNYLWLPLRAAQYPAINEGEPVGLFSQALQDVLNRVQYGKPRAHRAAGQLHRSARATSGSTSAGSSPATGDGCAGVATALFTVLGLSGLWTLWKTDRRAGLAAAALLGVLTLGLVFYMNFKYGFSQYPDQTSLAREVRERDYFFMGSFSAFGVFVALGLGAMMRGIVEFLRDRGTPNGAGASRAPSLLLALIPLVGEPRLGEPGRRDDGARLRARHPRSRWSPTAS